MADCKKIVQGFTGSMSIIETHLLADDMLGFFNRISMDCMRFLWGFLREFQLQNAK
jgi:hypothetical protein